MKSLSFQLNDQQQYRLMVLLRVLLASLGGFLIGNLTVPLIGFMFPDQLAMAVYTGLLVSFVVWLVFVIAIFSIKRTLHAFLLTVTCITGLGLLVILLKSWGAT